MASVLPRTRADGSVTWRVQFRVDGRMCQETFTLFDGADQFSRLVDAVGGEAARKVLRSRTERQDAVTLRVWTETYLDPTSGHLSGITEATRAGYQQIAERSFLTVLGDLPLPAITKQDVARWIVWQEAQPSKWRAGQPVSAKTIRNYHGVLSAILSAAADERLIDGNPAKGTRITQGVRQGITFLTRDEFDTLYQFIPDHYKPLTYFLAGTGMRWGEATALTWADFDMNKRTPTVRVSKAWKKGLNGKPYLGPPKTKMSLRTIALHEDLIANLPPRGPGDQLVFRGIKDEKRIWSERFHKAAWAPAVRAANDERMCGELGLLPIGKRPRVHDLRHAHASWLMAANVPLPMIQARLGHENITTTVGTYGHLMPEAQEQMAEVMNHTMAGIGKTALPLAIEA